MERLMGRSKAVVTLLDCLRQSPRNDATQQTPHPSLRTKGEAIQHNATNPSLRTEGEAIQKKNNNKK